MFKLILRCFDDATEIESLWGSRLKTIGLVSVVSVAAIASLGCRGDDGGFRLAFSSP